MGVSMSLDGSHYITMKKFVFRLLYIVAFLSMLAVWLYSFCAPFWSSQKYLNSYWMNHQQTWCLWLSPDLFSTTTLTIVFFVCVCLFVLGVLLFLKCLNNHWMNCYSFWYRHSCPPEDGLKYLYFSSSAIIGSKY